MQQGFFHRLLEHKTAANLFLLLMIILGLYASKVLNTQFFPNYSIDYININVEWPGASPKDIEESIIKAESKYNFEQGYKLLYVPWKTIDFAKIAFISLNPGEPPEDVDLRVISDEDGNSYEEEEE